MTLGFMSHLCIGGRWSPTWVHGQPHLLPTWESWKEKQLLWFRAWIWLGTASKCGGKPELAAQIQLPTTLFFEIGKGAADG